MSLNPRENYKSVCNLTRVVQYNKPYNVAKVIFDNFRFIIHFFGAEKLIFWETKEIWSNSNHTKTFQL